MLHTLLRSAFAAALAVAVLHAPAADARKPAAGAAAPAALDSIVAVVEEDVVLRSELDAEINRMSHQLRAQGAQVPPRPQLERQVLERLILLKLQASYAQQIGITVSDEEVDQAVANVAKVNNIAVAQLRDALARGGVSFATYREEVRRQILQGRVRQREVIDKIRVTDQEAEAFMARNPKFAGGGARVAYHLLHILAATPEGATAEQIAAARAKADRLVAKLRGGASFGEVARAESDGRQALDGGDLGWLEAAQVPSAFIDQVERMQRGDVSDPIRNAYGFNIVKLEDFRTAGGGGGGAERQIVQQSKARHILIRTGENASDAEVKKRLEALRERIVNGEDFGSLARANSDDKVSAANGGELGWVNPGATVPQFEEVMNKLEPGQLSQPFQTPFGWHILEVQERRQLDSTDQARLQKAKEAIRQRKAEEATELFLRRLRAESYVEIRLPVPEG
jgi:peptidyl-prolyl cis-trans isomerase SurA